MMNKSIYELNSILLFYILIFLWDLTSNVGVTLPVLTLCIRNVTLTQGIISLIVMTYQI